MMVRLMTFSLCLACGSAATAPEPAGPSASPVEDPPPPAGPAVEVLLEDPAADEGDFHSFRIRPDGTFRGEHVWSDGGAEDNRVPCTGRLTDDETRRLFDYARTNATLERPEGGSYDPSAGPVITVGSIDEAGEVRYAPRERRAELLSWAEPLLRSCGARGSASPLGGSAQSS